MNCVKLIHFYTFLNFFDFMMASQSNNFSSYCDKNEIRYRDPRIVGGHNAEKQEFPFIISLKFRGGHLCGGSIIHKNWVLSAAHCLCNGFDEIMNINLISGIAGLHKISDYKSEDYNDLYPFGPYQVDFKRVIVHPEYKCTKPFNDLALLEADKSFSFNKNVKPICFTKFSETDESYENLIATVIGFGWTNEDRSKGTRSDILQKAEVKVWNNQICQNSFINNRKKNKILETQLCAGYEKGGIDSCWADSGGPLILDNNLIGLVSTGIGCARPGLPGIYTRIDKFYDWINNVIEN